MDQRPEAKPKPGVNKISARGDMVSSSFSEAGNKFPKGREKYYIPGKGLSK
jgi:hypothetical protein